MLKATSLAKRHDGDDLFVSLDLVLGRGDRVGLVGPNGSGKSTLLRVLAGAEPPSAGQVVRSPGVTVGYFAQQVQDPQRRVGEFLAEGLGELVDVTNRLEVLRERMSHGTAGRGLLTEYGDLDDRWTHLTGWKADMWLERVRQRLDIEHIPDELLLSEVSGGEQARLALARVLLESPQVLLLDEPTNHLDADGIAWLGDWLAGFPGGVLVVSHDRDFLDRAVTRIVELDGVHEEPQFYTGGYTEYRTEKARRWARLLTDYEAQEKDRRRWEEDIERTRAQAQGVEQNAAKRGRDQQNRYAKKVAKKAKARQRRLQRQMLAARWLAEPHTRPPLVLAFPQVSPESGDPAPPDAPVLETTGLTVALGQRTILRDVDLTVASGDRILISGRNGAGKSTLLRVLAGQITPDRGQVSGRGAAAAADPPRGALHHDRLRVLPRSGPGLCRGRGTPAGRLSVRLRPVAPSAARHLRGRTAPAEAGGHGELAGPGPAARRAHQPSGPRRPGGDRARARGVPGHPAGGDARRALRRRGGLLADLAGRRRAGHSGAVGRVTFILNGRAGFPARAAPSEQTVRGGFREQPSDASLRPGSVDPPPGVRHRRARPAGGR